MKTFNAIFDQNKSVVQADEQFEKAYKSFMKGEAKRHEKALDFVADLFHSGIQMDLFQVTVALTEALMYYKQKVSAERAYADRLQKANPDN